MANAFRVILMIFLQKRNSGSGMLVLMQQPVVPWRRDSSETLVLPGSVSMLVIASGSFRPSPCYLVPVSSMPNLPLSFVTSLTEQLLGS